MALPENFVSRADLGWGNTAASYANISQGLVIHYDSGNLGLASKPHSACVQYWHNTRAFHRGPQRGWADIGYSFFSCPHDYILEGRGLNRQQAAQPGGNATHYSVTLARSEEHTSELQSRPHLVCRLLLEKKSTVIYSRMPQAALLLDVRALCPHGCDLVVSTGRVPDDLVATVDGAQVTVKRDASSLTIPLSAGVASRSHVDFFFY